MTATSQQTKSLQLPITGMTCASCASRIERKLNKLDGVQASVNYATEVANVRFGESVSSTELLSAIEAAGYKASLPSENHDHQTQEVDPVQELKKRLIISGALALPVVLLSMVPAFQFTNWQWLALQLATPVVVWGALPFHRAAWTNLRHGAATMDTLVSVGVVAAWVWSVVALFFFDAGVAGMKMSFQVMPTVAENTNHLYLEVATAVTAFLLAGRYFEERAKRRSGDALKTLMNLGAKEVSVVDNSGAETRKPIDQLLVGDRFVVRPGEKIATDGVIETGSSSVDMALLTGESLPVFVDVGASVSGGTINTDGQLLVRATRIGNDTALGQIASLVAEAQSGKAPIQRLADRVSAVFVPVVMILAVATLGFWWGNGAGLAFAFTSAVAVLIIACPCALGLATPTALLVGTGKGAQLGILIKGPEILESSRRIDTVVLDKTGTVTSGAMEVVDVRFSDDEDRSRVLSLIAAVENASGHPIAQAIVRFTQGEIGAFPSVAAFENHRGLGAVGLVDGETVTVGRRSFLVDRDLAISDQFNTLIEQLEGKGNTVVVAGWNGRVHALFAVADFVKPTSHRAIGDLKALGLQTLLLTGDNHKTALAVAETVGIEDVIAEVMPEDKIEVVRRLQADGHVVAMVGDGVNDAPALTQADLGIAIGTGTDVAIEASDLTLISGDLQGVGDAIELSRKTLSTIKKNLFWAFAYNVAAIPLAAMGLLNPLIAGAAMACSSVFVVMNSLRLRRFQPRKNPAST